MERIIHLDGTELKRELKEMVRGSVEETLNRLLDEEADWIAGAGRYERSPERVDTRAGHYPRKLLTTGCVNSFSHIFLLASLGGRMAVASLAV